MKTLAAPLRAAGAFALTASVLGIAGLWLASHHPASPSSALAGFTLWCLIALRWRSAWLFVLPACLPAAGFGPWTGWVAFDEFDLVLMGALAAGHARAAWTRFHGQTGPASGTEPVLPRPLIAIAVLCATSCLLAIGRAVLAADSPAFGWYGGEIDPVNAIRVGKSELYALLLLPLLRRECLLSGADVMKRFAAGMLVGAWIVVLAVLWERAAYPGLLDLSKEYRTVALFWEMHVGGAAIDAYLAMALPFVVRAVVQASTPLRFAASALLAVLAEYACLTTYSRGLYLAVAVGLLVFGATAVRRPIAREEAPWRRPAKLLLFVIVIGQLIAVLGADSFMFVRMERGGHDLRSRLDHWSRGIGLLRGASDWWLGKGMGRLPAEFAASPRPLEISGQARVVAEAEDARLELRGPRGNDALAGLYALSQRVPRDPAAYQLTLDIRTDRATRLGVAVCEVHLLYEGECRRAAASVPASGRRWQHLTLALGSAGPPSAAAALRTSVLSLTLLQAGSVVELDNLELAAGDTRSVLRNGDFSGGLAYWYPLAKSDFIPWHIDNLAFELLIEQGVVGLVSFATLMAWALAAPLRRRSRATAPADLVEPVLAAALVGALVVGLVSSVLDMPRVAFLLFFLAFLSTQLVGLPSSKQARRQPVQSRTVEKRDIAHD